MSISILCTATLTCELLEEYFSKVSSPVHQLFFHSSALESDFSALDSRLKKIIDHYNIVHVGYCGSALEKRQLKGELVPSYIQPTGLTEFYTQLHSAPNLIQF